MQKLLEIQKCDGQMEEWTDRPTNTARCRILCPRLKIPSKKEDGETLNKSLFLVALKDLTGLTKEMII